MINTDRALQIGAGEIVRRHLSAAQAKWGRLSVSDYSEINSTDALIAAVEFRYSLPHDEARRDVQGWLADFGYRPTQIR